MKILDSDFLPDFWKTPMVFLLSYFILHCRPSSFLPHNGGDIAWGKGRYEWKCSFLLCGDSHHAKYQALTDWSACKYTRLQLLSYGRKMPKGNVATCVWVGSRDGVPYLFTEFESSLKSLIEPVAVVGLKTVVSNHINCTPCVTNPLWFPLSHCSSTLLYCQLNYAMLHSVLHWDLY